jgi:quercetin dioxygenase-like cupin family protein
VTVIRSGDLGFAQLAGRMSADPLPDGSPCSMRVVRVPPGPRTPHRHPHSVELIYVALGAGRTWEGEEVSAVAAGDIVLVAQGAPHATVSDGPGEIVLVCFFPHPDLRANTEELEGPVRS